MEERIIKKGGKEHKLSYFTENDYVVIYLDGKRSENVWYDEAHKLYYSPFTSNGENFWVVLFRNNLILLAGSDDMSNAAFERDYMPKAHGNLFSFLYVGIALILPSLLFFLITASKLDITTAAIFLAPLFLSCLVYYVFNNIPVASTAVRKKLTFASFAIILLAAFLFAALILL